MNPSSQTESGLESFAPIAPATNEATPKAKFSQTTKVFHLINGEHYSGAERVQDLLAGALPEFGFEVGFGVTKEGIFGDSRKNHAAPIFDCTMKNRIDIRATPKAIKVIEEQGYELIHAHTPRSLMVATAVGRKTGIPVVYHVHSPVGRDSNRRIINWINTQIEQRNLRRTDAMICVSDSLKHYMQKELGHPEEKLHVVPNGVPCLHDVIPERKTPQTTWTIGTVALFRPRKGTEILLEGVAKLRDEGFDVRVHAVGSFETPEYGVEVLELSEKLGLTDVINWTGFTKNAIAEFEKMDLFVLPSLYGEGLPMVVLEAMASGVTTIAADVEGIPQAIRDRIDGLIFEPGNPDDLAKKVKQMIHGEFDWQGMRQSALMRQRDAFSDNSMAAGVAEVYRAVLAQ